MEMYKNNNNESFEFDAQGVKKRNKSVKPRGGL